MLRQSLSLIAAIFSLFMYSQSQASIILGATRVIFDGNQKEASVTAKNLDSKELLIQSWLDAGADNSSAAIPFAVTPPLAHMKGNGRQVLRILFQGSGVPTDKESVFWLNVQEIPKTSEKPNVLQLAIRQRIKLFYRPAGIKGDVTTAPAELSWQVVHSGAKSALRITNPSNYHVSMTDLKIEGAHYTSAPIDSFMIAPGATLEVPAANIPASGTMTLKVNSINDYGGTDLYNAPLARTPFKLVKVKPEA